MRITIWGTRGSLATPGPETARFGGNTSSIGIEGEDGSILALDAGTGIVRLGLSLPKTLKRIDILLTHLHLDHVQGLGFFQAMYNPEMEVHLWGPASTTMDLRTRLTRYFSPPLFPVRLRDLPCKLHFHQVPTDEVSIGMFRVSSWLVCHPGPTVGYRISDGTSAMAYLPDHEPALGSGTILTEEEWISGYKCAHGVDLLIHDSQYSREEYAERRGWGHSSLDQAFEFARVTEVRNFVPFHHDPSHSDAILEKMISDSIQRANPKFEVTPGMEGTLFVMGQALRR